jgi:hypothetical protein
MEEKAIMNKFERTRYPRKFGLNTEDNILIASSQDIKDITKNALGGDDCFDHWFDASKGFSIRTFYPYTTNRKTIHIPTIDKYDMIQHRVLEELLAKGLYVILAKQIDPKECAFRGCALKKNGEIRIEIAEGPGTVRTVTHEGIIDVVATCKVSCSASGTNIIKTINKQGVRLYKQLEDCFSKFQIADIDNVIFEFSYYKREVGYLFHNFICWEITHTGDNNIVDDVYYNRFCWDRFKNRRQ